MILVSISGIVGKYLYTRIPRSRSGLELTLREVDSRRRDLLLRIAGVTGLDVDEVKATLDAAISSPRSQGVGGALLAMLTSDFARWKTARQLHRKIRERSSGSRKLDKAVLRDVTKLARREIALTQQRRMLDVTQRIFGYWHVLHRPFSITAFVAVMIHVVLVVALGVTWLW